jgi:hypothetical protein
MPSLLIFKSDLSALKNLFIPLQAYVWLFSTLLKNTYSQLYRITGNTFEPLEVLQDAFQTSLKEVL